MDLNQQHKYFKPKIITVFLTDCYIPALELLIAESYILINLTIWLMYGADIDFAHIYCLFMCLLMTWYGRQAVRYLISRRIFIYKMEVEIENIRKNSNYDRCDSSTTKSK